jgi:hypothetical protein
MSSILEKNAEDHLMRINSQIQEFRRQIDPMLEDDTEKLIDMKKDVPKSLFSLKGQQFASKLNDWALH